ncbi:MAG TPA: helix-turn-helix domain-containing protein [Acidimicrobiales bacterium]|nr:helix-turn-helix domain-containing protein [Acidimicrobiales bacterium]
MFGSFIRQLREARGLSQSALADLVGIPQPNLSAYERDRRCPSAESLNRLVMACGYQLAATDYARIIPCPLPIPEGGWGTAEVLPGDPPDEAPSIPRDASPEVRGRALVELLELAEALRPVDR